MRVDKITQVTLTEEELNAVKVVHNMLVNLGSRESTDLNNELPLDIPLSNIYKGLSCIYELADGDMSELD